MKEELSEVDWKWTLARMTMEPQWLEFLGIIWKTLNLFIIKRKTRVKGRTGPLWPVKDSIKAKGNAYNMAKISENLEDWEVFKKTKGSQKKLQREKR